MKVFSSVSVLALSGILAACSGGQFLKGSATSTSAEAPAVPDTVASEDISSTVDDLTPDAEAPASPAAPTATPLVKDEDKTALNECLKQWTTNPFTPEEIAKPMLVDINEAVNNNSLIYTDAKVTAKPTLFLVNFNINVGNNGELAFLNPKGWYCFNVKAKVINNFLIKTACGTKVAIVSKQAQNDKNFTIQAQEPCP